MNSVNLAEKFTLFSDYCNPRIIAELNDNYVKVTKFKGEFIWHKHVEEDELFFVVKGKLRMKLRDQDVWLNPGEMLVIPRNVEHCPVAEEEVHIVLIEPKSTVNTGDITDQRTVSNLEWI